MKRKTGFKCDHNQDDFLIYDHKIKESLDLIEVYE